MTAENMSIRILNPSISKISISLLIILLASYFSSKTACGVYFLFTFCYMTYGFPFSYIVGGDTGAETTISQVKTLYFGEYFFKAGNLLINPLTLILNLILTYMLSCIIVALLEYANAKFRVYKNKI